MRPLSSLLFSVMKAFSPKYSKKPDPRQAEREARKAASRHAAFHRDYELSFISADGGKYYTPKPFKVPEGYTPAF